MKILGIIPARGGSKGVPRKNIRPILGRSLLERTFSTSRESVLLDRIVLSSEDAEIIEHAKKIGLEVPYIRPKHLASDSAAMIDVVRDLLKNLEEQSYIVDAVMLLQPTSPLRKIQHITDAVGLLKDNDSVCSVVEVPRELSPYYLMKKTDEGYLDYFLEEGRNIKRRQDAQQAYQRDGTVYLTKRKVLEDHNNFYGNRCIPMVIDPSESLSIDTMEDWKLAEKRLNNIS